MALRASLSGTRSVVDPFTLAYNDIKNIPGKYQHRNGKVLVVFSDDCRLVTGPTRTGKTRIGQFMVDPARGNEGGKARLVVNGDGPDGDKNWMRFSGNVVL